MGAVKSTDENKIFPRVMFAAPKSGSGKTVITCGFLAALKRRGMDVCSFKCGPDYIDPIFHSFLTGYRGINLDSFFLGRNDILSLFMRKAVERGGSFGAPSTSVIEGVMGYYDGLAGKSLTASSFDIARILDCPVILIINVKNADPSPLEELKAILDAKKENYIRGVIFNRAGADEAAGLSEKIRSLGVRCYGYVPECEEAAIGSRHLGLSFPAEKEKFQENIYSFSGIIESGIDVDGIIKLSEEAGVLPAGMASADSDRLISSHIKGRIAVADDEAFCFIYEDNLDFLRESGYEPVMFSPLHDSELPEGVSAILLSGGYPEAYAAELSANVSMLKAIGEAFGKVKILAECGGFLYLHDTLEGTDGKVYPMAGCIRAAAFRTGHSLRFGYISLYPKDNESTCHQDFADDAGKTCLIRGHEFHYWESTAPGSDLWAEKPLKSTGWDCMYAAPGLLAGFPHLYYRSGPDLIRSFLEG